MPGEATRPPVYVIIINYNGWRDTIECLESLLRSDYPALSVLVCDNASNDGSLDHIEAWARGETPARAANPRLAHVSTPPLPKPLAVTRHTRAALEGTATSAVGGTHARLMLVSCGANLGFAGANNIGLRWVLRQEPDAMALLLNNDVVIAPDAISAMVDLAMRSADVGVVGATILRYHDPERIETLAGATLSRVHAMTHMVNAGANRAAPRPAYPRFDYVTGCCVLTSRAMLERVGLMDERYFLYGEDVDWGLRTQRSGLRSIYCPEAEVWHKGGASVSHRSALHDYYDVRGRLMVVHKHFPGMVPLALVHSAVRCVLPKLLRGQWARLRAAARGCRDFVRFARSHSPASTTV